MPDTVRSRAARSSKTSFLLDAFPILFIVVFAVVILYFRIKIQYLPAHGPGFDTYAFLANGLGMAGKTIYYELGRPPVLPFIMSLFFRAGVISDMVAYGIEGFFYIFGACGLYLLFRQRLSRSFSLGGVLLYLTLPNIVINVGFGASDVIVTSLSIWLMYLTVLGAEKDERILWLVLPFFVVTFLTRYTAAVMLFPMLFYIFLRVNVLQKMKSLLIGAAAAGFILTIDIVYYYRITNGDALSQFLGPLAGALTVAKAPGVPTIIGYTSGPSWFLQNFGPSLSAGKVGWILVAILLFGLIMASVQLLTERRKNLGVSVFWLVVILIFFLYLILSSFNFLVANLVIMTVMLIAMPRLFKLDKKRAVDLLIFVWLLTFLCYHSHQFVKESRYFITMAPAAAYFIVVGLEDTANYVRRLHVKLLYPLVVGVLLAAVTAAAVISGMMSYKTVLDMGNWGNPEYVQAATDWLRPKLKKDSVVYADYFVSVAWYLRRPVKAMPIFKDPRGVNQELDKYHADYFVSIWQGKTDSYKTIKHFGGVNILAPKANRPKPKKSMYFVGRDLDHYLEDVLDFKYYIIRQKSGFADDSSQSIGNTYLDDYSLKALEKYPVLVLFNFKWHNYENAENLVLKYVSNGGSVVIDASGNSGQSFNDLNNGSFLGITIFKSSLSKNSTVTIAPEFKKTAPGVDASRFGPWLDEFGEAWSGSTYSEQQWSTRQTLTKLAVANKNIVIGEQKIGKGRVIWIGYNLIFHSFYAKNKQEQKLVQDVFSLAFQK